MLLVPSTRIGRTSSAAAGQPVRHDLPKSGSLLASHPLVAPARLGGERRRSDRQSISTPSSTTRSLLTASEQPGKVLHQPRAPALAVHLLVGHLEVEHLGAVSYTHLTLPTIYSV